MSIQGSIVAVLKELSEAYVAKPIAYRYEAKFGSPDQYSCFIVPAGHVFDGDNQIEITLTQAGQEKVLLEYMDLVLPWPVATSPTQEPN